MLDLLGLIVRNSALFISDINNNKEYLFLALPKGRFLVLVGAGSICSVQGFWSRNGKC